MLGYKVSKCGFADRASIVGKSENPSAIQFTKTECVVAQNSNWCLIENGRQSHKEDCGSQKHSDLSILIVLLSYEALQMDHEVLK